jgi:hypothetical protein
MILGEQRPGAVPGPRGPAFDGESEAARGEGHGMSELRQMVLHLETAALLEARARRAGDPAQQAVLRRRAEQRRREAARLRARLADRGLALGG